MRYKQINRSEKTRAQNGMVILKFFLHLSKKEQKKRFMERIDDPSKNWKFSLSDLKERAFWDDYQKAFEDVIGETSKEHAPWYVIPADDKWYARLAIAAVIYREFKKLDLRYPEVSENQKVELQKARFQLMSEPGEKKSKKSKKKKKEKKIKNENKEIVVKKKEIAVKKPVKKPVKKAVAKVAAKLKEETK